MRRILILILIFSGVVFSQEKKEVKEIESVKEANNQYELKINSLGLLVLRLDLSYEYLINRESSFGLGGLVSLGGNYRRNYSLTPYYRRYFSRNYAKGFFIEGFGMFRNYDIRETNGYDAWFSSTDTGVNGKDFALGVSVGGKFVSKSGFVTDIYFGLGQDLFGDNEDVTPLSARFGVSLGYRF